MDDLVACPGIGEKKSKRIYDAFHKPFAVSQSKKRKSTAQVRGEAGAQDLN